MPRGVAIPELREQLFQAADRLLVRDGPGGLSSRAITNEAGCAKGILHNHFTDIEGFLAEFVLDRSRLALREVASLTGMAGQATVAGNLTNAAASLFGSNALMLANVVMSRPPLMNRLRQLTVHADAPGLPDLEQAFIAYLEAEKQLKRVTAGADSEGIALALIATAHHLFISHRATTADPHGRLHRIVDILLAGATPPQHTRGAGRTSSDCSDPAWT